MKETAINYLMENQLLHIGMLEPIYRGTADILYAEPDGVLLKELKSNAYMLSVTTFERGRELLENITDCKLIVAHQGFMVDYLLNKYGLQDKLECFQAVYTSKEKLEVGDNIQVKQLNINHMDTVLEHYKLLSKSEIQKLLIEGSIYGGYREEALIGFVGVHLEGSIGLLEILPEFRRQGYGSILEGHMVNKMLEKGETPFAQVEINNKESMALQKKLGFKLSEDSITWMF